MERYEVQLCCPLLAYESPVMVRFPTFSTLKDAINFADTILVEHKSSLEVAIEDQVGNYYGKTRKGWDITNSPG